MKNLLVAFLMAVLGTLWSADLTAQCSNCIPGSTVTTKTTVLHNQVLGNYPCTFSIYYRYTVKRCANIGNAVEVEFSQMIVRPNCPVQMYANCATLKLLLLKAFTLSEACKLDPLTCEVRLLTNWSCCTTVELELPTVPDFCFIDPYNYVSGNKGYMIIPCDAGSCCLAQFKPIGANLVRYNTLAVGSSACSTSAPVVPPTQIPIFCAGYTYQATMNPNGNTLPPCDPSCTFGSGYFKSGADVTGVEEKVDGLDMSVYPNPASTNVTVDIKGLDLNDAKVVVYDLQGRQVYYRDLMNQLDQNFAIDISTWNKGMYFIQINTDEKPITWSSFEVIR